MSLVKRTLRTPAVTVSVAGTFASVIALVTAVFAVINAVWLNALPFAEPGNVVVIGRTGVTAPSPRPGPISEPEFLDWTERSREFDGLAAVSIGYGSMTAEFPGGARSLDVAAVTPNLFRLLGVHARLGRIFDDGDVAAGRGDLIVRHSGGRCLTAIRPSSANESDWPGLTTRKSTRSPG
jgi:hypothetical protein